jgi:iron complex transport system substrate-binding protein
MKILKKHPYLAFITFTLLWWSAAFFLPHKAPICPAGYSLKSNSSQFSTINRPDLLQGLNGKTATMIELINCWEKEARALHSPHKLSDDRWQEAQNLASAIHAPEERRSKYRSSHRKPMITDDAKQKYLLEEKQWEQFLPQTYAAASILISLTEADKITAIPEGIQRQKNIHPPSMLNKITLSTERYNSEAIHLAKPDLAFVAHYSHPSTVAALKKQGVDLFVIDQINTIDEVKHSISQIGHVINRSMEADLLSLFMESAIYAIDSRAQDIKLNQGKSLFLNYYTHYSIPTKKGLTGQILERLGVRTGKEHAGLWRIPFTTEEIALVNPEVLIISTPYGESLKEKIQHTPALKKTKAVQKGQVFFVNEDLQESPTQYLVLSYFELFEMLNQVFF